jgi:DNA polymerase III alpha subunit
MKQNNYGEIVLNETDLQDIVMSGSAFIDLKSVIVDETVDIEKLIKYVEHLPNLTPYIGKEISLESFDRKLQENWRMPQEYKDLDIAAYILGLCTDEAELQRCGTELLLYQERDLFNLLRYLKYLVDVMTKNRVIWGVGRGSSVASYVLYKMGVHRIDSIYYNLDVSEFLR